MFRCVLSWAPAFRVLAKIFIAWDGRVQQREQVPTTTDWRETDWVVLEDLSCTYKAHGPPRGNKVGITLVDPRPFYTPAFQRLYQLPRSCRVGRSLTLASVQRRSRSQHGWNVRRRLRACFQQTTFHEYHLILCNWKFLSYRVNTCS